MNRSEWNQLRRISGGLTKAQLVAELQDARDDSRTYDREEITERGCDSPGIDVRLQVIPPEEKTRNCWGTPCAPYMTEGEWAFHSGDSQYDQDHRGYWGASGVGPDMTMRDLIGIAEDLAGQFLDMWAEDMQNPIRSSEVNHGS